MKDPHEKGVAANHSAPSFALHVARHAVKRKQLLGSSHRESCIRENRPCSLSGGRRPARKRASSDPTPMNHPNRGGPTSAVSEERRPLVKENTHPSQSARHSAGDSCPRGAWGCGEQSIVSPSIRDKSRIR